MADTADTADTPPGGAPPVKDPGDRGRLVVADRVLERLAQRAAQGVDGVVTTGSTLDRAVGRAYPRVRAHVAGRRVRLEVDVAVAWPSPLPALTASVRSEVAERVSTLSGLQVDAVDVTAGRIVRPGPSDGRRVQ